MDEVVLHIDHHERGVRRVGLIVPVEEYGGAVEHCFPLRLSAERSDSVRS